MTQEFSLSIRVYYEDTDVGGIVFYANYLKYFERARTEWLRSLGISSSGMMQQFESMFVVKLCNVEYHAPARLDDELRVSCRVLKQGRASLVLEQQAWNEQGLLCSAEVTICSVATSDWRVVAIPSEIVKSIHKSIQNDEKTVRPL
ncbi:MAG: tol-pal system-associated acyl-CoA thioesterase [Undibacterium sp.]|nr:tol-pal system-associated acyl-CoA thioesterase [Undibacterium sp.]